jgi:hypothetical protein
VKILRHTRAIDLIVTYLGWSVTGMQPCKYRRSCKKIYKNYDEVCEGYMIEYNRNGNPLDKGRVCPCDSVIIGNKELTLKPDCGTGEG